MSNLPAGRQGNNLNCGHSSNHKIQAIGFHEVKNFNNLIRIFPKYKNGLVWK